MQVAPLLPLFESVLLSSEPFEVRTPTDVSRDKSTRTAQGRVVELPFVNIHVVTRQPR